MNRDFTIKKYLNLIDSFINAGYSFQRFDEYLQKPNDKVILLRHDVDNKPLNSLLFAKIQFDKGIKGVYYFRAKKCSWDEDIIREIHSMGHEIGYHYENLATTKGDLDKAFLDFEDNLVKLRKLVPVSTICMHGSPLSKYDNKDLWKKEHYKKYNIFGEPYFDIDFDKTFYLTDTGRCWNAGDASIRDKVISNYTNKFKSTEEIISSCEKNELPNSIMINFHPQRWNQELLPWIIEKCSQQVKNPIKKLLNIIQS